MEVNKNKGKITGLLIQSVSLIATTVFLAKKTETEMSRTFKNLSVIVSKKTDRINDDASAVINMSMGKIADHFYNAITEEEIALTNATTEEEEEELVKALIAGKITKYFGGHSSLSSYVNTISSGELFVMNEDFEEVEIILQLPSPDADKKVVGDEVTFSTPLLIGNMLDLEREPVWNGVVPLSSTYFLQYYSTFAIVIGTDLGVSSESTEYLEDGDTADLLIYFPRDGQKYYIDSESVTVIKTKADKDYHHSRLKEERITKSKQDDKQRTK